MISRDFASYYRTLDLLAGATEQEIRSAYKLLVNVWHPDRFEHDTSLRNAAEEKLKAINEAFRALQEAGFRAPPTPGGGRRGATELTCSWSVKVDRSARQEGVRSRHPAGPSLPNLLAKSERLIENGRDAEAIEALARAVEAYPDSFEAWLALAWACDNTANERGDAAAYQALRLGPNRPETTLLLSSKRRWRDDGPARALCERRVAEEPQDARA